MRRFFKERTDTLRQMLELRRPFRERFYDPNCLYDSRKDSIERSEAEAIESVKWDESGFLVVKFGEKVVGRRRFDVELNGGTLRIMETEFECSCLRHKYDATGCKYCGGRGWLNSRERRRLPEGFDVPSSEAVSDAELVGSGTMDSEILQFMAEHFRERAAIMIRWEEIYGAFTKRFFAPGRIGNVRSIQPLILPRKKSLARKPGKESDWPSPRGDRHSDCATICAGRTRIG